jgi:hypothetical protein
MRLIISLFKPNVTSPTDVFYRDYADIPAAVTDICNTLIAAGLNPGYETPIGNPGVITVRNESVPLTITVTDATAVHRAAVQVRAIIDEG